MERLPQGIVERVGDGYVGYCHEFGTQAHGRTVEETFANLYAATRQAHAAGQRPLSTADEQNDDVMTWTPDESDPANVTLAAVTAILLEDTERFRRM